MKKQNKTAALDVFLEWARTIVMSVFVCILIFTFVFRIAYVNGHSMETTLFEGDRLIISHLFYSPEINDIVVINSEVMKEDIIKRVIATGNQKVIIDYNNNTVSVDGKVIDEPYLKEHELDKRDSFSDAFYNVSEDTYEYDVPFGYVFVLGDNRNNSTDGRMIGFVSEDEIVGRVVFRAYSVHGRFGKVK